jgi:hypothetical protein
LDVPGGQDDGRIGVIAAQLAGQPQPGFSGHHDVDHSQVGRPLVETLNRFVGAAGRADFEAERGYPARHQLAHGRFVVHDQHGPDGGHREVELPPAR